MRKTAITILAFALILCLTAPAFAEKVGYVDFGKVLELTNKGQGVQKRIAAAKDELEIKIQEKELELRKLEEELKNKRDVMAKEVFEKKVQEFQKKYMESQQLLQQSAAQAQNFRIKQIRSFVNEIEVVVAEVAKANGFTMVLMKFEDMVTQTSFVLYSDASHDLTDKVIKRLNEQ